MDIRDELDAMLNNLKNGTPKSTPKASTPPPAPRKSVYDKMSVDELVTALSDENKPKAPEPKPATAPKKSAPQQPQNGIPQNLLDMLGDTADTPAKPRFAAKKSASAKAPKPVKSEPEIATVPEKPKKKRIIISGELPDYEEIRNRSLKEDADKAEREAREKAEREAREQAEREAREQAEREAREQAEREEREQAEREAREQAEREAREQAEREAREQAEREAREQAEREAREQAEREAREKAEREAREQAEREAREQAEREARESEEAESESENDEESYNDEDEVVKETDDVEEEEEKPKKGIFSGLKSLFSKKHSDDDEDDENEDVEEDDESDDEDDKNDMSDEESYSEELIDENFPESSDEEEIDDSEDDSQLSASELIDKALAAIEEENLPENTNDVPSDSVDSLIADIREDAANTIAEISESESSDTNEEEVAEESAENNAQQPDIDIALDTPKKKGRVVSALERILDEDPAALSDERREKPEADEIDVAVKKKKSKGKFKRNLFAFLGVIFTLLAIVGLIVTVNYGINRFRSFSVGETKRDRFTEVIYPAVIMDIESFANPSELASDQVISAALWSFVMKGDFSKYTVTFDIISVPAVDVESFAAQLFGDNLPELSHATVGSGELKFYYNEAQKCYNVPIQPISFTYQPEITYVSKTGSEYTITVDYIKELPAWMKDKEDYTPDVSKTVEFRITEKDDSYTINSMTVINVNRVD